MLLARASVSEWLSEPVFVVFLSCFDDGWRSVVQLCMGCYEVNYVYYLLTLSSICNNVRHVHWYCCRFAKERFPSGPSRSALWSRNDLIIFCKRNNSIIFCKNLIPIAFHYSERQGRKTRRYLPKHCTF